MDIKGAGQGRSGELRDKFNEFCMYTQAGERRNSFWRDQDPFHETGNQWYGRRRKESEIDTMGEVISDGKPKWNSHQKLPISLLTCVTNGSAVARFESNPEENFKARRPLFLSINSI